MRTRVSICVVAAASVVAGVLLPFSAEGAAVAQAETTTTPATAAPHATFKPSASNTKVPVRSTYETSTRVVSRDGGASVKLPDGHDLWIFGDTGVLTKTKKTWKLTKFIDGSTAVLTKTTKGSAPGPGAEVPSGVPARFMPVPNDLYLPDGSGRHCTYNTAKFPARWPTGAAVLGKNEVIISYSLVCVTEPKGKVTVRAEGWGYLLYNWKTHRIDHGPSDVFRPKTGGKAIASSDIFGSPQVNSGSVTFFSSQCTTTKNVGCTSGAVWSATVPATTGAMDKASSYKLHPLVTDGSGAWQPMTISVGRYGSALRLVTMSTIVGNYQIFTAPSSGAAWHLVTTGTLPGCPTHRGFCFALEGHPELSPAGSTFVSYTDPDSGPGGHVVVSALPT